MERNALLRQPIEETKTAVTPVASLADHKAKRFDILMNSGGLRQGSRQCPDEGPFLPHVSGRGGGDPAERRIPHGSL